MLSIFHDVILLCSTTTLLPLIFLRLDFQVCDSGTVLSPLEGCDAFFPTINCSSDIRRLHAALSLNNGHGQLFSDFLPCFSPKVLHAVHACVSQLGHAK